VDELIDEIAEAAKAKLAEAKKAWPKDAVHPDVSESFVRAAVDPRKDEIIEAAVALVLGQVVVKPAARAKR